MRCSKYDRQEEYDRVVQENKMLCAVVLRIGEELGVVTDNDRIEDSEDAQEVEDLICDKLVELRNKGVAI